MDRVETLWCFRVLWGENSKLCSKMQIGLVETFNTEQRNNVLVYVKKNRAFSLLKGGVANEGFIGVNKLAL